MYIKSPGQGIGWRTFIDPFNTSMWISSVAMIILGAFVVAVTYHIGKKFNEVEDLPFTFGSVVFISFCAFFQQGKCNAIIRRLKISFRLFEEIYLIINTKHI